MGMSEPIRMVHLRKHVFSICERKEKSTSSGVLERTQNLDYSP